MTFHCSANTTAVNECALDATLCHHFCRDTEAKYECLCDVGYKLKKDGKNCEPICKPVKIIL